MGGSVSSPGLGVRQLVVGGQMKKLVAAALAACVVLPGGIASAADGRCYTAAAMEADQAYHFIVDLMVASTACRDQTYGLFQQRNQASIRAYQATMIAHFHGHAGFDAWDTALANEASMKHAGQIGAASLPGRRRCPQDRGRSRRQGVPRLRGRDGDQGRGPVPYLRQVAGGSSAGLGEAEHRRQPQRRQRGHEQIGASAEIGVKRAGAKHDNPAADPGRCA